MKFVVAPDSYKGSLSSAQAADIIADEIHARFPDAQVVTLPLADGGEGSLDIIMAATGGHLNQASVQSPDKRTISASFGVTAAGKAVLEMAQSSGITRQQGLHPTSSNTYGFGQLLCAALYEGARDFYLCIGGSATTDGGCGMASAMGVVFLDAEEKPFVPCGATLGQIASVDTSGIDPRVKDSRFRVLCDVDNPLFGATGAAHVFAPQKGASAAELELLDAGLRHLSEIFTQTFGRDLSQVPGAGAAGGLGFGSLHVLDAELTSGIEAIIELYDIESQLQGASYLITGEGRLDEQSLSGKVLSGLMRHSCGVPLISICGSCDLDVATLKRSGVRAYAMGDDTALEESLAHPEQALRLTTRRTLQDL